jgi:hypothetical protein
MHIKDASTFKKLVELEGEAWGKAQLAQPANPYGFQVMVAAWDEVEALKLEHADASLADLLSSGEPVIYGEGGYHRYIVRDSGEVQFSRMHARAVNVDKAVALGFTLT